MYQLYYYVPETHLEQTKQAIFAAGAGTQGTYTACAWQTQGTGQFKPISGSNPFIGELNTLTQVPEYKVETICAASCLPQVIAALKASHPYECPAFGIIALCQ